MALKRKLEEDQDIQEADLGKGSSTTASTQPEQLQHRTRGCPYTVSLAVCSSMVDNAQSLELATMLAGQVARCAGIYCVDEIVVVDDYPQGSRASGEVSSATAFLARVLQYMETPQYLRRTLIPSHPHLKHVGLLPPLNAPHHPRSTEWTKYREGVVLESNNTNTNTNTKKGVAARTTPTTPTTMTSLVNVGLEKPVQIHKQLRVKDRVTVRLKDKGFHEEDYEEEAAAAAGGGGGENTERAPPPSSSSYYRGKLVSSEEPRKRKGIFWGYSVRIAHGITDALTNGPYSSEGGYDLKIGTSERGDVFHPSGPSPSSSSDDADANANAGGVGVGVGGQPFLQAPGAKGYKGFKHAIIAFGAVDGLEFACKNDVNTQVTDPSELFDLYLNTCASQGSRTIRAEEAMMISMACLSFDIQKNIQFF